MIEQATNGQSIGLAWSTSRSTLERSTPGFVAAAGGSADAARAESAFATGSFGEGA